MVKISAVIITFNEERNIGRCIDSLRDVVDEIVVVDSFSQDNTKAICVARGVHFIEHPFASFGAQKNFAVSKATYDCVLSLDADEFLSDPLKRSIQAVRQSWPADAYAMNRLNKYGTKWIRHGSWYPDRKIRMWDRRRGRFISESLHEYVSMDRDARVQRLRGDIMHEAFMDVAMLMTKTQRYSKIYAETHAHRRRSSLFKILYRSRFAFLKSYLLKLGFLDGYEGFIIANSVANDVFYKYTRLYELNRDTPVTLIITMQRGSHTPSVALRSALSLSVMPEEIILAGAGGAGEPRDITNEYADRFHFPLRLSWLPMDDAPLAAVRNKAVALATQPYVVMVDGDVIMSEHFIRDHKRAAWRGRLVQGVTQESAFRNVWMSRLFSSYSANLEQVSGANMAFWRSKAIAVNGFDENIGASNRVDADFVARMLRAGTRKWHLKFAALIRRHVVESTHPTVAGQGDSHARTVAAAEGTQCDNGIDKYLVAPPHAR